MANTVVRPVGYTGSIQQLVWNNGNGAQVTAYLWGGGGGGGGNDSARGGYGSGAGFSTHTFTVNNGDVIKIAVGGGGGAGASGQGSAPGGSAGASWIPAVTFDTRVNQPQPFTDPSGNFHPAYPVFPQTNRAWCGFLNSHAVWVSPNTAAFFENWYPITLNNEYYNYVFSTDNFGDVLIVRDGTFTSIAYVEWSSYTSYTQGYFLPPQSGLYWVRIRGQNTGGPGGIGFTINQGFESTALGYSGGMGGVAGSGGSSGGGGGSGGATVLFVNNTVVAVAGGGAGGGGGGNRGAAAGQDAPGSTGQSGSSTAGQNGQNKGGDGGGGGAGGGGANGGNGGDLPSGDQGGYAGFYGSSLGTSTANPSGRTPGGSSNLYYTGAGTGGINTRSGQNGSAVFTFDIPGVYVNQGGTFTPVSKTWVNNNGTWSQAQSIYVKNGGTWNQVLGGTPPIFNSISGNFGVNPRSFG